MMFCNIIVYYIHYIYTRIYTRVRVRAVRIFASPMSNLSDSYIYIYLLDVVVKIKFHSALLSKGTKKFTQPHVVVDHICSITASRMYIVAVYSPSIYNVFNFILLFPEKRPREITHCKKKGRRASVSIYYYEQPYIRG